MASQRVTIILDSGGVGALASQRARLAALRDRGVWPARVPAVVLTESLTGDHRRDFRTNRLLRLCDVHNVSEDLARAAARLRTLTGRAATIAATDAIVAAFAAQVEQPIIMTSDSEDLRALVQSSDRTIAVAQV